MKRRRTDVHSGRRGTARLTESLTARRVRLRRALREWRAHRLPGAAPNQGETRRISRRPASPLCETFSKLGRPAAGRTGGQALIEIALIAPFVFFLIVLVIDFAALIGAWIVVANAARAAADYAILGGASAGLPTPATSAALQSLINTDMAALPGLSSTNPNVCIRENNNSTYTTILQAPAGACANYSDPPSDGEDVVSGGSTQYADLAVDITYTYTPFIVGSKFLGYFLPNIPTSVHRRSVMRIMQ